MRAAVLAVLAVTALSFVPPADGANSGVHAGLADDVWADPYFRAGALLADVDHWLPPGEPQTDSLAFALGIAQRAWTGSRNAWRFADGWYEELDQDARFIESLGRILAANPSYTVVDVRLAFDYLTIRDHPFPTDHDWILADGEILQLVAGGLTATNASGVRSAVDQLLHSTNASAPGLALQLTAASVYGLYSADRVANMKAEYDRYYVLVTAGYVPILPRIDVVLRVMAAIVAQNAANPSAVTPPLRTAMALEAARPPGWMAQEAATLAVFVEALPGAGLPMRSRFLLTERAIWVADYLT